MAMINVAVKCINNRDAGCKYFNLVNVLKNRGIALNRLVFHQLIVGSKKCKVRFYSCDDFDVSNVSKVDIAFGFSTKEQREILKDGCKISRKFVSFEDDYTEELLKYFVDNCQIRVKS